MKGIFSLIILLMASGLAAAQLEDYSGFPKNVGASVQADVLVTSLYNNSQKDILVVPDNRQLYVFRPNGTVRWNGLAGVESRYDYGRRPAVSDINGDGRGEIIMYGNPANPAVDYNDSAASLYIWDPDGNLLMTIPVGKDLILSPPSVADVGEKIMLVGASPGSPPPSSGATGVYAYNSSGGYLWYLDTGPVVRTAPIAVGDIDGDAKDEAAVVIDNNGAGRLAVLKLDSTGASILWTKDMSTKISGVAIDDINSDGKNEVIIGSGEGVYVWDGNGNAVWSNSVPVVTHSPPAIADINGDGVKDVVIGSDWQKQLFAISGGSMMPGFPVPTVQSVWSRPALQDIDGDGRPEIIAADFGGYIYGWNYKGSTLPGFPTRPVSSAFMSSPVLGDLEGTGRFQIVAGNSNGNIYAYTYNYTYDTAPPVTADNVDGLWHNSNVTVTLAAEDNVSGVATTYYTTDGSTPDATSPTGTAFTITGEGVYTIRYFSVDRAGNAETAKTAANQVKIDRTPPVTADDADGAWHNSNVTVRLTAEDAGSGIAGTYYTMDGTIPTSGSASGIAITVSSEGSHTIKYLSVDNAGNIEPVKETVVKIDSTPPVTGDDSDGLWHNGSVTVRFTAEDAGSGVAGTYYTTDGSMPTTSSSNGTAVTISDEGNHTIKYFSVDGAGNAEPVKEAVVRIDATPPVTTDDSDNLWHNTDVVLNLKVSDNLAGVAALYYNIDGAENVSPGNVSIIFKDEGIHTVEYWSADSAGNAELPKNATVKIDRTPPVTADDADGVWHNSNVTVNLSVADNLSGMNSTYYKVVSGTQTWMESLISWVSDALGLAEASQGSTVTVTDEGIFNIHYYSTDNAGNTEVEKTSLAIKVDKTVPSITVNVPENRTYLHSDTITLDFAASDALSGIKAVNSTIDGSAVSDGQVLDMLNLSFGAHEFSIAVEDNAGNSNGQRVGFTVIATIDSLIALDSRALASGWMNDSSLESSLDSMLKSAKQSIQTGQNTTAKNQLEAYINNVQAQSGNHITAEGADILTSEARYVIDHLQGLNTSRSAGTKV